MHTVGIFIHHRLIVIGDMMKAFVGDYPKRVLCRGIWWEFDLIAMNGLRSSLAFRKIIAPCCFAPQAQPHRCDFGQLFRRLE